MCEESKVNLHPTRKVHLFDLNCIPDPAETNDEHIVEGAPETAVKKKKRAATEDIAKISMGDLVKYFDVPITEASRSLNVGLTALKRKCRELGIPRWPHRKIKSLDTLIHNLQEEAEQQEQVNKAAAIAVVKRQKMLESEKECIERKPFMQIQTETKRFRQDVFKKRHKARAKNNNNNNNKNYNNNSNNNNNNNNNNNKS
ncbi:RWP-RK domain [Macleaya cordata]|uniref:RWP-RK domain n=1 Tax=Macleaya cordata TaxID=56857 RepID=A0A200RA42_MACCD|nr:RWP-RK domain [Macleaya cordata]